MRLVYNIPGVPFYSGVSPLVFGTPFVLLSGKEKSLVFKIRGRTIHRPVLYIGSSYIDGAGFTNVVEKLFIKRSFGYVT